MADVHQLELSAEDPERPFGSAEGGCVGDIEFFTARMAAQRVARRKAGVLPGERETLSIVHVSRGSLSHRVGGRSVEAGPDDLLMFNSCDRYVLEASGEVVQSTIKVPLHALRSRLPWIDRMVGAGTTLRPSLLPSVSALLGDLVALQSDRPAPRATEAVCVDLIAMMLETERLPGQATVGVVDIDEIAFLEIRRFVDNHLADSGLSASSAGAACGMSERKVQKLFQARGMTFRSEVRDSRLRQADRILGDAAAYRLSIGEIAYRCGFASQAHFASCYRGLFGITPRERRRSMTA